jgi:hypothetical protein
MTWVVEFDPEFKGEFEAWPAPVRLRLLALFKLLAANEPQLGRPFVDTLRKSSIQNLKELRSQAGQGAWRVLIAFSPIQRAIQLCGGNKDGQSEGRFYRRMINLAEHRWSGHNGPKEQAT